MAIYEIRGSFNIYMKICEGYEDLQGCRRICGDMRGTAKICDNVRGYARICEDLQGCIGMCEDIRAHMREFAKRDIQGCTRIYVDDSGTLRAGNECSY